MNWFKRIFSKKKIEKVEQKLEKKTVVVNTVKSSFNSYPTRREDEYIRNSGVFINPIEDFSIINNNEDLKQEDIFDNNTINRNCDYSVDTSSYIHSSNNDSSSYSSNNDSTSYDSGSSYSNSSDY
jgi:hypothetical protein